MSNTLVRLSIALAAINTTGMAAYHFFLPRLWGWDTVLVNMPPAIRWASHSINFFFSFFLICGGILTFLSLRGDAWRLSQHRALFVVMGGFWATNLIYQLIDPLPLPPSMAIMRVGFVGFAALTCLAYAVPLVTNRELGMGNRE
jgi:hypothetical protein